MFVRIIREILLHTVISKSNTGLHFNYQQVRPAIVHASPLPPLKPYLLGHVTVSSVCKHQTTYATTSYTLKHQNKSYHLHLTPVQCSAGNTEYWDLHGCQLAQTTHRNSPAVHAYADDTGPPAGHSTKTALGQPRECDKELQGSTWPKRPQIQT